MGILDFLRFELADRASSIEQKYSGFRICTVEKIKFSIKDFFIKCDQIRRKLSTWLHLLKKSLMENLIFCAVSQTSKMEHFVKIVSSFSH